MKKEGIYYIRLKQEGPLIDYPKGTVLYIGKGDDVARRLDMELGGKSGPATFFRSIGLLLSEEVVPKSGKRGTGYNFKFRNPEIIIRWLKDYTCTKTRYCDWRNKEKKLIQKHRPPLNIIYNAEHCHPELKGLRLKAHKIAAK